MNVDFFYNISSKVSSCEAKRVQDISSFTDFREGKTNFYIIILHYTGDKTVAIFESLKQTIKDDVMYGV